MTRRTRVLLVAAVLTSCSNPSEPQGAPAEQNEMSRAVTRYATCLRNEGVEVTGLEVATDGTVESWPRADDVPEDLERRCSRRLRALAFAPTAQEAAFLATARRFSECMREEGIDDFPEPSADGFHLPRRIDPKERRFQRAERQCRHVFGGDR